MGAEVEAVAAAESDSPAARMKSSVVSVFLPEMDAWAEIRG